MSTRRWRQARALFWVAVTGAFVLLLVLMAGVVTFPGLPPPSVDLSAYRSWVFAILILLSTKALLEGIRPLFHAALRSHVRSQADIFAHFKLVSYVVWATAFVLVLWVFIGTGAQENGLLSSAIVLAAFTYVMQEPLLDFVGWLVLVTMQVYKLGDRIEVNQIRGVVVGISPMTTTLREFGGTIQADVHTGRFVTVPNSQVLRGNVINATKDTDFVWDQVTITVSYKSDAKAAEAILLEVAESVVGSLMRTNREGIREKYEFADLLEYVQDEPTVIWGLRDAGVDLTLVYFCPVFERAKYRTAIIKRVLDEIAGNRDIQLTAPAVLAVPAAPMAR